MQTRDDKPMDKQLRLAAGARIAGRTAGLLHLGSGLAAEILDVVERMHGTISQRPLPVGRLDNDRTSGITGIIYRGIRNCFEIVTEAMGGMAREVQSLSGEDDTPSWVAVRAAINGVCGDALEERGNPLAMPMRIVSRRGDPQADTLVLFLHGLCMSEHGWQRGEFPVFERWCREQWQPHRKGRVQTAHLRYNSGRRISVNGRELAGLLENEIQRSGFKRLVLVGHSMGGLLIRSACHYADGLDWLDRLSHAAMLGTPHEGAPLERIGNLANGILKVSPYSRPLSQLGDLRSCGIKDLRFANLIDEDWIGQPDDSYRGDARAAIDLPEHVTHLTVGATRSQVAANPLWHSRDDYLVPVSSALGMTPDGQPTLEHGRLRRELVTDTGHIALMGHATALSHLRDWLNPDIAPKTT